MKRPRALALLLPLALLGASSQIPWTELVEGDWLYRLATRFSMVDGHRVHYPTPPAELAKLLEERGESAALRQLAEARLSLGDRKGALEAMTKWASLEGAEAQAETARWAASHHEMTLAFQASERALPGLSAEARRSLADERVAWADRFPELADPLALRKSRVDLFPDDEQAVEAWLRALERAGRLAEVDQGLAAAKALNPERRLLLRSDLLADHGDRRQAFQVLDGAVESPWSLDLRRAYALRVDGATPSMPSTWRGALDTRYDAGALVRLATYFQGKSRGEAAADLLRQVERRYEAGFGRKDFLLLSRLHAEIDAAPEAFRARLGAARLGSEEERNADLAELAQLALKAGGRPLAWGGYNDESYRWAARVDRTPGFWTGGLSFLLTGLDWKEALGRLESESLPDRTFATARLLAGELARRAPAHPDLPALRVALMERHVERGEGREALALLPLLQSAPAPLQDRARRAALLAARQTSVPLDEEAGWMKARLRNAAADGTKPSLEQGYQAPGAEAEGEPGAAPEESPDGSEGDGEATAEDEGRRAAAPRAKAAAPSQAWSRIPRRPGEETYAQIFQASLARLEHEDPSHRHSLDLILTELDRLPQAESLWMQLTSQLESWKLDDGLGPRYERALKAFDGPGIWDKLSRWYARRNRDQELHALAEDLIQRFRGAAIFTRAESGASMRAPEQPPVPGGTRMVNWADWVRLKALERFPHSPTIVREAARLTTYSSWKARSAFPPESSDRPAATIVSDDLMEGRRWAILFVDRGQREEYFATAMAKGDLESRLAALEAKADRGPVEDLLLFEGWARLSRFERAMAAGDHLAAAYPGDGDLAGRVLSLHRSLNGLESSHAAQARVLVDRTAPALEDAGPLWTELGELEEERGRPAAAIADWQNLLAKEPRNPARVSELATLLWDYNHDREALKVVEEGRARLGRPRFFAFETGVLRENVKDLDGAIREYLDAARPDGPGFGSTFEQDQRALRRLAQLLAKDKVFRLVERRIVALRPGQEDDEEAFAALLPLATIEAPHPGLDWDADAWIDGMDLPNDAKGRAQRKERRQKNRPAEYDAIARVGDLLLDKSEEMIPQASSGDFLDALSRWSLPLRQQRWEVEDSVRYEDAMMARRAKLARSEEERIPIEMARAAAFAGHGMASEADAVWAALLPRIDALPEGSVRLRAEAQRAAYLERSKGVVPAAEEWRRITARHPWSLGLLEDRLAFLDRTALGEEGRALLETSAAKAAEGHRQELLERLVRDSLAASDLPRARRAVEKLLGIEGLDEGRRLQALHLRARLAFRENPAWDPAPLVAAQAPKLDPGRAGDLYHELALAADLEGAAPRALGLWIEALNRRTDREWLVAAARSASKSGRGAELLAFFEKQRERSPRDVRWAVAVRDIKRAYHQVDGAIDAAKAAVAVRPERQELWQEAAELMVRDGRVKEAADYLEGWNRPRPADEGVAHWRSGLYARSGEDAQAFAIEQAALRAFQKERPAEKEELANRRARAASALLDQGLPQAALRLFSPAGDARALQGSRLADPQQCDLALLTGQFTRLLDQREGDTGGFLHTAASHLREKGRPEQQDEVQAWMARKLYPMGAQAGDDAALDRWWSFIEESGLEPALKVALASRLASARPGPWQGSAPLPFLQDVGWDFMSGSRTAADRVLHVFHDPDLARYWMRDLARRDRAEELLAFVEPRWQDLLREVQASSALSAQSPRQAWAYWLDERGVMACWARAAAAHPEKSAQLASLMGERRAWDRFWALAARGWDAAPLVALLPEEPRAAWFHYWDSLVVGDPVLLARRRTEDKVAAILGRLVQGVPGAEKDFIIHKLRGPQTIGEVLGKDGKWTWSQFDPRRDAKGEIAEAGVYRLIGQGADKGRLPGALWGERPGEAWFVLEAMARYRGGDKSAALIPLAVPRRGNETDRALLAIRSARALGDLDLALQLQDEFQGPAENRAWLEERLAILDAAGRKPKALAVYRAYLKERQGRLSEEEFHWLAGLAAARDLPSPMGLLDPAQPLDPVFLAFLHDQGLETGARYQTKDWVGFRIALADRWRAKEDQLDREQIRFWLRELWANGASRPGVRALAKLGGPWRHTGEWLDQQAAVDRLGALGSLEEALVPGGATPAIFAKLEQEHSGEVERLLALRLHLARGEKERAMALVDGMLASSHAAQPMAWSPQAAPRVELSTGEEGEGDLALADGSSSAPVREVAENDPLVARLRAWLAPFKEAKASQAVEARFLKRLEERRAEGPAPLSLWFFAFGLTPAPRQSALAAELDEAWFRGEIQETQARSVALFFAKALPAEAPRWLGRWPRSAAFSDAGERARALLLLKQPAAAASLLVESRRRAAWSKEDEVQAFDLWRKCAAPQGPAPKDGTPATWIADLPFWTAKAEGVLPLLGERLKAHPHDSLASRAALRALSGGDEEVLARAAMTLDRGGDQQILKLRAARGLLATSPRAAALALGSPDPKRLSRDLAARRYRAGDITAALGDLARIAARNGEEARARAVLELLTSLDPANAKTLAAELALSPPKGEGPNAFRLEHGRPAPILPKDLTWALYAKMIQTGGAR